MIKIILEDLDTGKVISFKRYEEFLDFIKPFMEKQRLKLRTEVTFGLEV